MTIFAGIMSESMIVGFYICYLLQGFIVWWWVLDQKGRTHWLMWLGGLGVIVTLCLKSKAKITNPSEIQTKGGYKETEG